MVQKTGKLLIFLNHNLVGFKNTRTFVLKEKGRFFGAIPSIFPLHQRAIIHSKNMRIASPFAVALRARTYYIHMKCFCCPFRAKSGRNTWHPGCCPKRQAGLSARIHQLRLAELPSKSNFAINSAIWLTLPFITYYFAIYNVLLAHWIRITFWRGFSGWRNDEVRKRSECEPVVKRR